MKTNIITKVWLALFGEFDWQGVPVIPPEIIFFPRWAPFNIYELSSWARATIMALSILSATRPVHAVPPEARIDELYVEPPAQRNYRQWTAPRRLSWAGFFLALDRLFRALREVAASSPVAAWRCDASSAGSATTRTPTAVGAASCCPGSTPSSP